MAVPSEFSTSQLNLSLNPCLGLGLQHNPFVAEEEAGVAAHLWIDRGWSNPPLIQSKQLVQLIGLQGTGKTSHLKHWQAQTGDNTAIIHRDGDD